MMTHGNPEVVETKGVHEPVGPYSHAIRVPSNAEWLYVSGQIALDKNGNLVGAGDLKAQTDQVFTNLDSALLSAGFGFEDVIKTTTYLVRPEDVAAYREIRTEHYRRHFPSGMHPASTLVVVQRLASEAFLLEIEAVAARAPA
jgi:enamine deaminase RidA (YjgF/YER057c/UK114 family)